MSTYFVLGGCGFIGRNIVLHLVNLDSCSKIVVADKSRPELSYLTQSQKDAFKSPKVTFQQINLTNQVNMTKLFSSHTCDYVINAAAETRLKMPPEVYNEYIFKLGACCAEQAAANGCKMFIQLSSSRISYLSKHKGKDDDSSNEILKCQKKLEDELANMKGLNYCILRLALVYGSGDKSGITPLLIMGSIYKKLDEIMKMLGSKDVSVNTVHVEDVVRACQFVIDQNQLSKTWDIADKSSSTQGSIVGLVSEIFHIKYEFIGSFKTQMAKNFCEDIIDDINQKHLAPWAEECASEGISHTPLTPYINEEQLIVEDFSVNGSAIEEVGFQYKFPTLTASELKKVISEYVEQKLFPKCYFP